MGDDTEMKAIRVPGVLGESLQSEGYDINVDLQVDDDERIVSYSPSLLEGPSPRPPTGDYKLIYFYLGQQHEESGHVEHGSWLQAAFGAVRQ
jgi:hypothetical protein